MFVLALGVYLTWQMTNLRQMNEWLTQHPDDPPPQSAGIWDEIFNALYRRDKAHRLEVKRVERRLDRYQESTTALPDATIILNKRGNIEWLNERSKEYLGLKERDVGNRIENLIRNPRFVEYLHEGDYEEPLEMPSPINRSNTLLIRIVPYGRSRRLLVARDMTRLQRLERMRRDFIANFSHELRTPLTVLRGYLEGMGDDNNLQAEWGDAIRTMNQQIRRMEHINDDLLFLSRLENPDNPRHDEEINVCAMLAAIREDAQALSQGKHEITLECDDTIKLIGSHTELRNAFSNLAFNAVRYTPAGGRIRIRWQADGEGASLEVEDNGEGIAPQHISRITERFYRVDAGRSREKGGTGLGLAIVKHVANRHHAQLDIQSHVGEGSLFRIRFPQKMLLKAELDDSDSDAEA
jgi:two-component system phosphate regulon sensor histidine kinase PhoR